MINEPKTIAGPTGIWACKIGETKAALPAGADAPMRAAVEHAYRELTGEEAAFTFSGWSAELTEGERAVVENRLPQSPNTTPAERDYPPLPGKEIPSYSQDALMMVRASELRAYYDLGREAWARDYEAGYSSKQLAVMVLSDCGHSSDYTPLLNRVAGRIDRHVEWLLTAAPQPPVQAQEPLNLKCKSTQKRLATLWGFVPAQAQEQEPFGYFRAGPDGWTDCAETDEGAIALYELPQAARDVLAERQRQISAEGWTPEHDDAHNDGSLARAAAAYAAQSLAAEDAELECGPTPWWPWGRSWWKPASRRRMLEKAGALVLAEIERLDRAAARAQAKEGGE